MLAQFTRSVPKGRPELRSAASARFRLKTTVVGSGRVPHVRLSVHGPKTGSSNAFTPCARTLFLVRSLFTAEQKRSEGCAPPSSAHVRSGEHGAPVQGRGLRSLLYLGDAEELHQAWHGPIPTHMPKVLIGDNKAPSAFANLTSLNFTRSFGIECRDPFSLSVGYHDCSINNSGGVKEDPVHTHPTHTSFPYGSC